MAVVLFGAPYLAEFYGCSFDILNDLEVVKKHMIDAALFAGQKYGNCSISSALKGSGVVVISSPRIHIAGGLCRG